MFKRYEQAEKRNVKFKAREEWLLEFVEFVCPDFEKLGKPIKKVRVACGLTSSKKAVGQCFHSECSEDKAREIIISATLSDPVEVCETLIHELCHAVLPEDAKHGPQFREIAIAMGLEGPMTSTVPSDALRHALEIFIPNYLGVYPHKKMTRMNKTKQSTRMIKLTCDGCGMVVRSTRKWIDEVGTPACACGGNFEEAE